MTSFNTAAQRLYARLGYQKIGEITDFAIPGVHEHLLRKTLGPQSTFKPPATRENATAETRWRG